MTTDKKSTFILWPYAIVVAMILFMGYIAMFVYKAMNQDVDLVTKDYYEQEIKYQDHIDKMGRTQAAGGVAISYKPEAKAILLQLPASFEGKRVNGNITLFRPSDDKLDHQLPLQLGRDRSQLVETKELQTGMWEVRIDFTADEETYYTKQTIQVK